MLPERSETLRRHHRAGVAPFMALIFSIAASGCGNSDSPIIKPADRGIEVSPTQIRSALGRIQTAVNAAEAAASAAAPRIFVDNTLEQKSYLCLDAKRGPIQMDYTTKGQFKRTLSDGSSEIGFRFESFEGTNKLTGVQYGKSEPLFYKTSLSDGQSAEVWKDVNSGGSVMRCFLSIGLEYLWFDHQLMNAARQLSVGPWRCSGPLESIDTVAVDMAGRSRLASGGAAQWFIWADKQDYRIDVFQSPQPWPAAPSPGASAGQAASKAGSIPMLFTSVAEYTIDLSGLAGGKWSYTAANGASGSCSRGQ